MRQTKHIKWVESLGTIARSLCNLGTRTAQRQTPGAHAQMQLKMRDLAQRDVHRPECGKQNTQNGLIALAPMRGEDLVLLVREIPNAGCRERTHRCH